VEGMPVSSNYTELALYVDKRAIITILHHMKLLTDYFQTSLSMQT